MKLFLMFLQYIPMILATIKAIEDVYQSAPGPVKKELIMNALPVSDPQIEGRASEFIDATIATLNKGGVFVHLKNQKDANA